MDFLKYAKENEKEFFEDLDTLVRIESTRDLSTKEENAPG